MNSRSPAPRPLAVVGRPGLAGAERSTVFVRGIHVEASIGMYAHEREALQPLVIDVELELIEPRRFGADKIAETINYESIVQHAKAIAAEGHVILVETFAERLAAACLEDRRVASVRVRIEKPRALEPSAVAAGVELIRRRR